MDRDDSDLLGLPLEAGSDSARGFEPNDAYLADASAEERQRIMRRWFLTRYQDPVMETPHSSEEGYIYIHGGPFRADEELFDRFEDLCNEEEIEEAIEELESEGIDEWAPIHYDPDDDDFDAQFALILTQANQPLETLRIRLEQSKRVLELEGDEEIKAVARNMVFSAMIGVLEAYLYEVAFFWVDTDDTVLRNLVEGLPHFRERKVALADVFKEYEKIKGHVKGYLQNLVWHRWEKVAAVFKHSLGVRLPSMEAFGEPLKKRHDIVHRSGRGKDGSTVQITEGEVQQLAADIEVFAQELNGLLGEPDEDLSVKGSDGEPDPEEST
jgi:hypothetical protein